MGDIPSWLPKLVLLDDYYGNWDEYLHVLYSAFKKDFIDSRPFFRREKLALKRYPIEDGKEATFWHVISEGKVENERIPDLRRCERIPWIRPIIEHEAEQIIKVWENYRKNEKRILLWF